MAGPAGPRYAACALHRSGLRLPTGKEEGELFVYAAGVVMAVVTALTTVRRLPTPAVASGTHL